MENSTGQLSHQVNYWSYDSDPTNRTLACDQPNSLAEIRGPLMMPWHGINFNNTGPLWWESIDHQWLCLTKDQWCGALIFIFCLKSPWINSKFAKALGYHDSCDNTTFTNTSWAHDLNLVNLGVIFIFKIMIQSTRATNDDLSWQCCELVNDIMNYITYQSWTHQWYIDGLVQACSISVANALEVLQSCTKLLTMG